MLQVKKILQQSKVRHRARLVSASDLSSFQHSLAENAPTIAIKIVRLILSLAATWDEQLKKNNDSLIIHVHDVTKAYLKFTPTHRLIIYKPPKEPKDDINTARKTIQQLYVDVESGRYWHHTLVP